MRILIFLVVCAFLLAVGLPGLGSLGLSTIKAASGNCGKTFQVEQRFTMLNGDWFCVVED